jgi:hypothetical protein
LSGSSSVSGPGGQSSTVYADTSVPVQPAQGGEQSIEIIEIVPPVDEWEPEPLPPGAGVIFGGGTVPVSGGGAGGPAVRPEFPGPVVTGPDEAKPKQEAPRITTGLGKEVDDIINMSPTMRELWAKAQKENWKIEFTDKISSRADPKGKTIFLNKNDVNRVDQSPAQIAAKLTSLLSHEIGHAATPFSPTLRGRTREEFVEKNTEQDVRHEATASFLNAQARWEIKNGDPAGPDIGVRGGFDEEYLKIYDRYLYGDLTQEQAIAEMAAWAAKEPRRHDDGTVGTTEEVFARRNAKYYEDNYPNRPQ